MQSVQERSRYQKVIYMMRPRREKIFLVLQCSWNRDTPSQINVKGSSASQVGACANLIIASQITNRAL